MDLSGRSRRALSHLGIVCGGRQSLSGGRDAHVKTRRHSGPERRRIHTPLLVIGAGPYGLATAACAKRAGIEELVIGEPMAFWRENMPSGMMLRSGADWHLDAAGENTFMAYLKERGLDPHDFEPIPVWPNLAALWSLALI